MFQDTEQGSIPATGGRSKAGQDSRSKKTNAGRSAWKQSQSDQECRETFKRSWANAIGSLDPTGLKINLNYYIFKSNNQCKFKEKSYVALYTFVTDISLCFRTTCTPRGKHQQRVMWCWVKMDNVNSENKLCWKKITEATSQFGIF